MTTPRSAKLERAHSLLLVLLVLMYNAGAPCRTYRLVSAFRSALGTSSSFCVLGKWAESEICIRERERIWRKCDQREAWLHVASISLISFISRDTCKSPCSNSWSILERDDLLFVRVCNSQRVTYRNGRVSNLVVSYFILRSCRVIIIVNWKHIVWYREFFFILLAFSPTRDSSIAQ